MNRKYPICFHLLKHNRRRAYLGGRHRRSATHEHTDRVRSSRADITDERSHYGPRGINGPIDDLLFPINHGVLFYPGYEVLPPFVVYQADRLDDDAFRKTANALRNRLRTLLTASAISFRYESGGDYVIPSMQLRPEIAPPELTGFVAHVRLPRSAIGQPTPSQHINQQDEKI